MSDLTILTVTAGAKYALHPMSAVRKAAHALGAKLVIFHAPDARCIENVLDEAIASCPDGYILRLDDDETLDSEAVAWLTAGGYRKHDHWAFRRKNLYPDAEHFITNPPLWPDLQTRLSIKEKSGGRTEVHVGSPFGTGTVAPGAILHHKFLVRTREEREALVAHYESIQDGAGRNYAMFSVPDRFEDRLQIKAVAA